MHLQPLLGELPRGARPAARPRSEARTHEGTQRLFAAHFVRTNAFAAGHLKTLARLEGDRLRADYQGYHRFAAEDVDQALPPVGTLVTVVLDYLAGYEPTALAESGAAIRNALAALYSA